MNLIGVLELICGCINYLSKGIYTDSDDLKIKTTQYNSLSYYYIHLLSMIKIADLARYGAKSQNQDHRS